MSAIEEEVREILPDIFRPEMKEETVSFLFAYVRAKLRDLGEEVKKEGQRKEESYWDYAGFYDAVDDVLERTCGKEGNER